MMIEQFKAYAHAIGEQELRAAWEAGFQLCQVAGDRDLHAPPMGLAPAEGGPMSNHDDEYTDEEIAAAVAHVERHMTVEEIFEAGYKSGHANAGIHDRYEYPFRNWLTDRLERAQP